VRAGSFSFQPVEIAKILLCVFFASYFAENKELLSIPTARVGNRLVIDRDRSSRSCSPGARHAGHRGRERHRFALLIFILFIGLLWIATGRFAYLVLGLALFGVGAYLAAHLFTQFHERVSIWLDPWTQAQTAGYQLVQGWYALGSGGVGGVGLGHGIAGQIVPRPPRT